MNGTLTASLIRTGLAKVSLLISGDILITSSSTFESIAFSRSTVAEADCTNLTF